MNSDDNSHCRNENVDNVNNIESEGEEEGEEEEEEESDDDDNDENDDNESVSLFSMHSGEKIRTLVLAASTGDVQTIQAAVSPLHNHFSIIDNNVWTALAHIALMNGHPSIAELILFNMGCDHWALIILLSIVPPPSKQFVAWLWLVEACAVCSDDELRNTEVTRALEEGADINYNNSWLMRQAVLLENSTLITLLLSKGAREPVEQSAEYAEARSRLAHLFHE